MPACPPMHPVDERPTLPALGAARGAGGRGAGGLGPRVAAARVATTRGPAARAAPQPVVRGDREREAIPAAWAVRWAAARMRGEARGRRRGMVRRALERVGKQAAPMRTAALAAPWQAGPLMAGASSSL